MINSWLRLWGEATLTRPPQPMPMLGLSGAWLCSLSLVPQGSGLARLRSSVPNMGGFIPVTWIPLNVGGLHQSTLPPWALPRAHACTLTKTARVLGGLTLITIGPPASSAPTMDLHIPTPPARPCTKPHLCPTTHAPLAANPPMNTTVVNMAKISTSPFARTFSIGLDSTTHQCIPKSFACTASSTIAGTTSTTTALVHSRRQF
jgi:hypothetical protein